MLLLRRAKEWDSSGEFEIVPGSELDGPVGQEFAANRKPFSGGPKQEKSGNHVENPGDRTASCLADIRILTPS